MGTLLIIFISLLAVANGTLWALLVIEKASLQSRIAMGSVFGLAALSWVGFLTALLVGLNAISISLTTVIFAIGLGLQLRFIPRDRLLAGLREIAVSKIGVVYYAAWTALLVWLFARVVMFYPDGMHTAPANNFGDLPFHFSAITSFAYGENLPPQNPIFAGMNFTYPFLIDFLTAFFIRCGADWRAAFFVENIVLALALVSLIEFLTLKIFDNRIAARIAPVIFLFNGGLGFINFFRQLGEQNDGLLQFLAHLPNAYTMNADLALPFGNVPLRWGNVFTTLLIPQRSMLFGLPIVAMIIAFWWMSCEASDAKTKRRYLLAAGTLAGLLPMLHAHGFFSVMIASALMVLLFRSWDWIAFFAPASVLAAPQALWLGGTQVKDKLFTQHWWWEAGQSNPLVFWMVNAGVFILLLLAALLVKKGATSRQKLFYLPFALWFIAPNVVTLAPWTWDNIKMLVYWSLASCPFVAVALAVLFTQRFVVGRLAATFLLFTLAFSGALDVTRALSPVENVSLFGQEELEVAALLREKTPPRALILHAPIHNSVVALSGRQSVMGYPGHLWTHGINYAQREPDVAAIYQGGAETLEPLARLGVDYVVIGPAEQAQLTVDEDYFAGLYSVVIDHAGYRVYRVKN
ncbi:MAG: hypothetical protein ACREBD_22830 [Blastocatellia bacterium]